MIPETKNDSYVPFGEEWEKEIMKCSKSIMVQLYKKSCQRSLDAEKEIERLKGLIKSEFLASHVIINKKATGYQWNEIYGADWEEYCKENNL